MSNPLPFLPLIYLFICFPFFFYFVMLKSQNASHGYALCFAPFALSASSSTYRFVYFFFVQSMNYYFEFSCVFLFGALVILSRSYPPQFSSFPLKHCPQTTQHHAPQNAQFFLFFCQFSSARKRGKGKCGNWGREEGKGELMIKFRTLNTIYFSSSVFNVNSIIFKRNQNITPKKSF